MESAQLNLLGVSFRTASAAVRETLSFNDAQAASLLRESAAVLLQWQRWMAALPMGGVIKQLHDHASEQSRATAGQLFPNGSLSEAHAQDLVRRAYKRLLHDHLQRLRRLSVQMPLVNKDGSLSAVAT